MKKILARFVLDYLRYFAKLELKKHPHATIIGITGSMGKTSTRLALVAILEGRGVVKHSVHANSQSGISLDILGLYPRNYSVLDWLRLLLLVPLQVLRHHQEFNYYIVEMGIDGPSSPNNMDYLLSIVRPHIAIILNAGLSHAAAFDHLVKDASPRRKAEKLIKVIAAEKMLLAKGIGHTGVAVVNLDQKEFARSAKDLSCRLLTFGKSEKADLRILPGLRFHYQGITHQLMLKDVYPDSFAYTFAAALAGSAALGIPPSISLAKLSNYRSPAGRLRLFKGILDSTIIDSSYNASPATMLESLKLLQKIAGKHKKIAVLGDMLELGISEKIAHKDLADQLTKYCDEAILFGELTKAYTLPVLQSRKFRVRHFATMPQLLDYLKKALTPKAFVLIKGSQNGIYLERAVAAVLSDKSDLSQLCRRGKYWDRLRSRSN